MKIYALESGFLSRLLSDRRELLGYARSLGSADAMRVARADLMAATKINLTPKAGEERKLYTVDSDKIAHIPIVGELTPSAQTDACGAYTAEALTEYGYIQAAVLAADADPEVLELALDVNSPGGYINGLDETAQILASISKPITAYVGDMAASAAYWLASQADKVVALSPASRVGSIGVAAEEYDDRAALEDEGIAHRVYTSTDAPDKRPDTATPEGRAKVVSELDDLHAIFVRRVASGRHVTQEKVNKDFGHGAVVIAEKALKAGMIDEVRGSQISRSPAGVASSAAAISAAIPPKEVPMDLNQLKAEHPEAYKAAGDEAIAKERARVAKLTEFRGLSASGDKLLDEAMASGADYLDIAPRLTAAVARGNALSGDNAPEVRTATPEAPAGAITPEGMSATDVADLLKAGMTMAEITDNGPMAGRK